MGSPRSRIAATRDFQGEKSKGNSDSFPPNTFPFTSIVLFVCLFLPSKYLVISTSHVYISTLLSQLDSLRLYESCGMIFFKYFFTTISRSVQLLEGQQDRTASNRTETASSRSVSFCRQLPAGQARTGSSRTGQLPPGQEQLPAGQSASRSVATGQTAGQKQLPEGQSASRSAAT